MSKVRNPYNDLLGAMRRQGAKNNPPGIRLGMVVSTAPLTVSLGDLQIDAANIRINAALIDGFDLEFSLPSTAASGTAGDEAISSIAVPDGTATLKKTLKAGDRVAVQPTENRQTYIILCKVVAPNG